MSKSEIFTAAHKMAKTFEGHYSACFALALREIYASMKEEKEEPKEHKLYLPYSDHKERKRLKNYLNYTWLPNEKAWLVRNTLAEITECNLHGYLEGGEYCAKKSTPKKSTQKPKSTGDYGKDYMQYGFDFAEEGNHTGI